MDDAIIQVEDLVKVFGSKVPVRALDGLDLTVERGGGPGGGAARRAGRPARRFPGR